MAPRNLNILGSRAMRRLSTSSSIMPKRPSAMRVFNTARLAMYFGILVCTVICLAIAAHFESMLETSELTRFVPLAIFVSVASFLVILSLLLSTVLKQRSPISTRIELSSLGLLAVLWLVLGSYLAASEAAEADVECFSAGSTLDDPVELPGFTTDIFHAQYRVLEAFSIFNLILVFISLLVLAFLALREHRRGYRKVWLYPVPQYPWFERKGAAALTNMPRTRSGRRGVAGGLPKPVTAKDWAGDFKRQGSTRRPNDPEKQQQQQAPKPENRRSAFWVWVERPHRKRQQQKQQQGQQASSSSKPAFGRFTGAARPSADRSRDNARGGAAAPSRPPMRQMSTSKQPLLTRQVTTREYTRGGNDADQGNATNARTTTAPRAVPAAHARDYRPERAMRELERDRSRRGEASAPRRTQTQTRR